jgi:hypothetical protein
VVVVVMVSTEQMVAQVVEAVAIQEALAVFLRLLLRQFKVLLVVMATMQVAVVAALARLVLIHLQPK